MVFFEYARGGDFYDFITAMSFSVEISLDPGNILAFIIPFFSALIFMVGWWFLNRFLLKKMERGSWKTRVMHGLLFVEFYFTFSLFWCFLLLGAFPRPYFRFDFMFVLSVTCFVTVCYFVVDSIILPIIHYLPSFVRNIKYAVKRTVLYFRNKKEERLANPKKTKEQLFEEENGVTEEVKEFIEEFTRNWIAEKIKEREEMLQPSELLVKEKEDYAEKLGLQLRGACKNEETVAIHYCTKFAKEWGKKKLRKK